MSVIHTGTLRSDTSPFVAGVAALLDRPPRRPAEQLKPFITISREAGAGGRTLAQRLVDRLNEQDPGPAPWRVHDAELVQEVVTQFKLPQSLVDSLDEHTQSWLEDLMASLSLGEHPSEETVYNRMVVTIRALAESGRSIIVGRGGVFITRTLPHGLHIRLVAPLDYRISQMSERLGVSRAEAAAEVAKVDADRDAFYRRYWQIERLSPEYFTLTLNTAALEEEQMVRCILPLLPRPEA